MLAPTATGRESLRCASTERCDRAALGSNGRGRADIIDVHRATARRRWSPRLGQGAFRLAVTDGYERRCAVTGERTLPILDAAHSQTFAAGGAHEVATGLLLRTDIHRLFDLGYVTVSEDRRFEVSRRLKAEFDNGRRYYALQGQPVRPPHHTATPPSAETLRWQREHRFLG